MTEEEYENLKIGDKVYDASSSPIHVTLTKKENGIKGPDKTLSKEDEIMGWGSAWYTDNPSLIIPRTIMIRDFKLVDDEYINILKKDYKRFNCLYKIAQNESRRIKEEMDKIKKRIKDCK